MNEWPVSRTGRGVTNVCNCIEAAGRSGNGFEDWRGFIIDRAHDVPVAAMNKLFHRQAGVNSPSFEHESDEVEFSLAFQRFQDGR